MRPGALARVLSVAVLFAACNSAQPTAAPGSNTPGGAASTSAPGATGAPAPSPSVTEPDQPTSASTAGATGSYSVVLTGAKTGAGTYAGTGDVYCSAATVDGRVYWTATAAFPNALSTGLSQFSIQQNPSSFDSVMATAGGMETGLWMARSDTPGQTAHVGGNGAPGTNAQVTADGSFTDMEGKVFTIHVSADCSETYY